MDKPMMTNLKQAISSVLETMFFLPVQIIDNGGLLDNWSQQCTKIWRASVRFEGPVSGAFILLIPTHLAKEITANFLGLDENEVESNQESDTVKEALNMIGGYVLSQIERAEAYQIGIPEILATDGTVLSATQVKPQNMVTIETDENHLAVGLHLD